MAIVADLSGNAPFASTDRTLSPNKIGHRQLSITLPATPAAYAARDVVGGVLSFTNMQFLGGGNLDIISARLTLGIAAVPSGMTNFELHMYNASPPSALADNAAFDLTAADLPYYQGKLFFSTPTDEGSSLSTSIDAINKQVFLTTDTIYAYLVTIDGYTPAAGSEVYRAALRGLIPNEI